MILAFDMSTKVTGYSLLENNKLIKFGEINLDKYKTKKNPKEYLNILYTTITNIIKEFNPDIVCVEETYQKNVLTLKSLSKIRGILELCIVQNNIKEFYSYMPSSARKIVFNKGNITKEEACSILSERFKVDLKTNGYDASDSIVIALCHQNVLQSKSKTESE